MNLTMHFTPASPVSGGQSLWRRLAGRQRPQRSSGTKRAKDIRCERGDTVANMARKSLLMCLLLCLTHFVVMPLHAQAQQNPVQVHILIHPPYSPYLDQMIKQAVITITNTSQSNITIVFQGKISNGSKFIQTKNSIYSRPVTIAGASSKTLNNINFDYGSFLGPRVIDDNLTNAEMNAIYGSRVLPEGTYTYCLSAFAVVGGEHIPIQHAGTLCATFSVFFAQPPIITSPIDKAQINNLSGPVINFAWMPPAHTTPGSNIQYDLYLVKVNDGDDPKADMQNAFTHHSNYYVKIPNIKTSNYIFKTKLNSFKIDSGQQYAVMVQARDASGKSFFANEGKSQVITFNTGTENNESVSIPPVGFKTESLITSGSSCSTDVFSGNTKDIGLSGDELFNQHPIITIGKFTITLNKGVKRNADGTYIGTGHINWKPFINTIELKVAFNDIKVNTDGVVYSGKVTTSIDGSFAKWAPLTSADNLADEATKLTGLKIKNSDYTNLENQINDDAHLVNQIAGNNPVDMPLGLNNESLAGIPSTLAIMGMTFTPTGAGMTLLYNMNIPEANGWLALAGTCFPVTPNGFSLKNGILYLPNDRDFTIGETKFTFKGCDFGSVTVDTTKGTYVQLEDGGFKDMVAEIKIALPQNAIVPVNSSDQPMPGQEILTSKLTFTSWNDWVASLTVNHDFEIAGLPGFRISAPSGGFYDHSNVKDPDGFHYPKIYTDSLSEGQFMGLYIPELSLSLPNDFVLSSSAKIAFNQFILDHNGVTTLIDFTNPLNLTIGGWAARIDHIHIPVLKNNPQKMEMDGALQLPVSKDWLTDTCNLNAGEPGEGIQYQFRVSVPHSGYHVNIWAATLALDHNSSIVINNNNPAHDFAIMANLNGDINISTQKIDPGLPALDFTALSFQGLGFANYDTTKKVFGFFTNGGKWKAGGGNFLPDVVQNKMYDPIPNNDALLAGGPRAPENIGYIPAYDNVSESTQGHADGFSLNVENLSAYTDFSGGASSASGVSGTAKLGIQFTVKANLDAAVLKLSGDAGIDLYGNINFKANSAPSIDAKPHADLTDVSVKADLAFLSIDGSLAFFNDDSNFGDGVRGYLDSKFLGIALGAGGVFGTTKKGMHYWGVAARFYTSTGIYFPPGLSINGLGGGFYYNMAPNASLTDSASLTSAHAPAKKSDESIIKSMIDGLVPSSNTFGFKAQLIMAYLRPEVISITAGFGMTFSSNHGLVKASFDGTAHMLSNDPPEKPGFVNAAIDAFYTPIHHNFHADIDVNLDFGLGSANLPITINTDDNDQDYLWIGTPAKNDAGDSSMINVQILGDPGGKHDGPFYAYLGAYAYFDIGTVLPGTLYIPDKIRNKTIHGRGGTIGDQVKDYFDTQKGDITSNATVKSSGTGIVPDPGFMLGAGVSGGAGINFVVVAADVSFGAGLAVIVKHYTTNEAKACNAGGVIGFDNWYAMGDIYAYVAGDLSVGGLDVASLDAGAFLAGGIKDPTWAFGDLYLDVSVLFFSFTGDVPFSIGTACTPPKNPLDNIQLISDFGPKGDKDHANVSVYAFPDVIGTMPFDKDYTVQLSTGKRTYQFRVTQFDVTSQSGKKVSGSMSPENDNYEIDLTRNTMLCGNTTYNAHVTCEAFIKKNGSFIPAEDGYGNVVIQDTTFTFTTGPRPGTIEDQNIVYAYPIKGQRFLLKDEFGSKGEIQTGVSVGYLLTFGDDGCSSGDNTGNSIDIKNAKIVQPALQTKHGSTQIDKYIYKPTHGPNASRYLAEDTIPTSIRTNATILISPSPTAPDKQTINRSPAVSMVPAIANTKKLVAKFIPSGGGRTLQTSFTANNSGTEIYFPLPQGLQNDKAYTMQLWVIPPPQPKNNAVVTAQTKGTGQTTTQVMYRDKTTGQLKFKTETKKNNVSVTSHKSHGQNTMASKDTARLIYTSYFSTSRYNTFKDKMAAYGVWNATKETLFTKGYDENAYVYTNKAGSYSYYEVLGGDGGDITLYNNNPGIEPFDEFEIKGYQNSCSHSPTDWLNDEKFPPMFSAQIPWSTASHNDKDAGSWYNGFRSGLGPYVTFQDNIAMARHSGLYFLFAGTASASLNVPQNSTYTSTMPYMTAMQQAPQQGGMLAATYTSTYADYPLYNTSLITGGNSSNKINLVYDPHCGCVMPADATTSAPDKPKQGILWKRDNYFRKDFRLLQSFAGMYLDNSNIWWLNALITLPKKYDGVNIYSVSGKTGAIRMNVGQIKRALANSSFTNYMNKMAHAQFVPFPPTSGRTIQFQYTNPFEPASSTTATGTFNYQQNSFLAPHSKRANIYPTH